MKLKRISYPYLLWMIVFILVPMFLVLAYSFGFDNNTGFNLSLSHYKRFFDPLYLKVLAISVRLALFSTIICLFVGYPMAMALSNLKASNRNIMVLLFVIPMWMNFLLRTYSWMSLLERNGIINKLLKLLGLPILNLLYTNEAVILGMIYNFLPFMVLPIYSVLIKIDRSLIEAAYDLGANRLTVFKKVILPLSVPGVISGTVMVFMPAVTTFVISRLLGGGQFTLIGNLIEQQFLTVGDWNFGSAISIILMILILLSMAITMKNDKDKEGMGLW